MFDKVVTRGTPSRHIVLLQIGRTNVGLPGLDDLLLKIAMSFVDLLLEDDLCLPTYM